MDNTSNYEELQEKVVFYRTHFCKKVMDSTSTLLQLKESEIKLNAELASVEEVQCEHDPTLDIDQCPFANYPLANSEADGKLKDDSTSKNVQKVKKLLNKIKLLEEAKAMDKQFKELPNEVIYEKLRNEFGIDVS